MLASSGEGLSRGLCFNLRAFRRDRSVSPSEEEVTFRFLDGTSVGARLEFFVLGGLWSLVVSTEDLRFSPTVLEERRRPPVNG